MTQRCPDCNQLSSINARVCTTCGHTFFQPTVEKPPRLISSSHIIKKSIQNSLPESWVYGDTCRVGKDIVYLASCPTYKGGKVQTFESLRDMMRLAWQHKPTLRKKVARA